MAVTRRTQKKVDSELASVEAEITALKSSEDDEIASVEAEIASLEGAPTNEPYGLDFIPGGRESYRKNPRLYEPAPGFEPPPPSSDIVDETKAFAAGAGEGATYNAARLSERYRKIADALKASSPTSFSAGKNLGGGAAALVGPEALALKAVGAIARPLLGAKSYLANALGGGVQSTAAATAGSAARSVPLLLNEETTKGKALEDLYSTAQSAPFFGGAMGLGTGAAARAKAGELAPRVFDKAIPEDPDVASKQAYVNELKRMGISVPEKTPRVLKSGDKIRPHGLADGVSFDQLDNPPLANDEQFKERPFNPRYREGESKTRDILKEDIRGKNPKQMQIKADIRLNEIENELQPILNRLDRSKSNRFLGANLQSEFDANFGDDAYAKFIGRDDARKRYQDTINEVFSKDYTPSELNAKKRELYQLSKDKAFKTDATLGPVEQAYKDLSLYAKAKIEQYADSLKGDLGKQVRDLNNRSGAMQEFFKRLDNTKNPKIADSLIRGARHGFYAGAGAGGLVGLAGIGNVPLIPASALAAGVTSGALDYVSKKPSVGAGLGAGLQKYSKGSPGADNLIKLLSFFAEKNK